MYHCGVQLTLQLCVLGGAVLFIFCGVSVRGCAALLPAAAAALALAVYVAHLTLADKHIQVFYFCFSLAAGSAIPTLTTNTARGFIYFVIVIMLCFTHQNSYTCQGSYCKIIAGFL